MTQSVLKVLILRVIIITLLAALPLFATFESDMETLAMNMAKTLKLSPQTSISMTTIPEDKSYMLSMVPVFNAIKKHLTPYVNEVRLHSFRGEENAILRSMILSGSSEYAPINIRERRADSLVLTGSYYLIDGSFDKVNFIITVINLQSQTLFQSLEYTVSKTDCPPAIKREIFSNLHNKEAFAEIEYRGRVIKKLDNIFNSANNNLLAYPAEYRFDKRHPYAIQWQVDILKEIMSLKYAISFNRTCKNSIILEPAGALIFIRDGNERQVDNVVEGEPLLPAEFLEEFDSLYYLHSSPHTGASQTRLEKKCYATVREKTIRDRIHETFNTYYPGLFSPFNYDMLDKIFVEKAHPSILVGTKLSSDPRTGRETVTYRWHSKKSWLIGLLKAHLQRERTFDIDTRVMGVFNDNLDPHRYWAVILQKWNTMDRHGKVVYEDDGFLIVNFDFRADLSLKDFKVHYRLWFYNYQYDDIELGIARHEKLVYDINKHFVNGMGGIDTELKNAMRDFIIDRIRMVNSEYTSKKVTDNKSEIHAGKR